MSAITIVFVTVSLVLMAFGIPVFVAFGAGSALHEFLRTGNPAPALFSSTMSFGVTNLTLLAIPLFLYVGKLMNETGLTHVLFDFANQCVGAIRGGLGQVNVFLSMIFAGMSGSEVADIVGLGSIEMNAMKKAGYDERYAAGITLSSSLVGPIIPPSISAILYAILAEVPVSELLFGLLVPGLLMGGLLMVMVYVLAVFQPKKFPRHETAITFSTWWMAFRRAAPCLVTPLILIGGIASGVFTATESAAFAGIWLTFVSIFWYRCLDFPGFWRVMRQTAIDSSVIMIILGAATLWMWILTRARIPYVIGEWSASVTADPLVFMLIVGGVLLLVGCFTSVSVAINILVPILAPVAVLFEIDPLHFAAFFICVLNVGNVTPPFGLGLFALQKVTGMAFTDLVVGMLPFLLPMFAVMVIVMLFPAVSTWLPSVLF